MNMDSQRKMLLDLQLLRLQQTMSQPRYDEGFVQLCYIQDDHLTFWYDIIIHKGRTTSIKRCGASVCMFL